MGAEGCNWAEGQTGMAIQVMKVEKVKDQEVRDQVKNLNQEVLGHKTKTWARRYIDEKIPQYFW